MSHSRPPSAVAAPASPLRPLLTAALLVLLACAPAAAQDLSGGTPAKYAPGAPAGSYALSGFDNVNLYTGNLNFRLPLLGAGGRGGAGTTVALSFDAKRWLVKTRSGVDANGFEYYLHRPDINWWGGRQVGYGPGVMQGRRSGDDPGQTCNFTRYIYRQTLTRLTFTGPDGTEYNLRDQLTEGQPATVTPACAAGAARGRVFVSDDGSAATFTSDADIFDRTQSQPPQSYFYPSGYLVLRDGTRYRIDAGNVTWLRDRNGNRVDFSYDANNRVTSITDSLGRQITVEYDFQDAAPYGLCDRIKYRGFGDVERIVRVSKKGLASALRTTQPSDPTTTKTHQQLFPELNDASATTSHNPQVRAAVWLPDGRSYQLFYNVYGELARVALPTGGAVEYDYTPGSGGSGGGYGDSEAEVNRRLVERRVYEGGDGTPEEKTTYGVAASPPTEKVVTVDQRDPHDLSDAEGKGKRLGHSKHYFSAGVFVSWGYSHWMEGREFKTEAYGLDAAGNVSAQPLRRVEQTWA